MKVLKGRQLYTCYTLLICLCLGISNAVNAKSCPITSHTQDPFNFYLLSVSWSPEWCIAYSKKAPQCLAKKHFVLHGLWPEYETGKYPSCCEKVTTPLDDVLIKKMVPDILPSQKLMDHQWAKHGTCALTTPAHYFELSAEVYQRIKFPDVFYTQSSEFPISRYKLRDLLVDANQAIGLKGNMFVFDCEVAKHRKKAERKTLDEVRFCVDKKGDFMTCPETIQDRCNSQVIVRYE